MAVSDAVRRSGSLLRALTVGGLATAAWLVCAGSASADTTDHPDEVPKPLDTVNIALDEQGAGQLSGVLPTAGSLLSMPSASDLYPTVVDVPGHPVGQAPTVLDFEPATLTAQVLSGLEPTGAHPTGAVPVDTVLSYDSLAGPTQFGSVLLGPAPPGSDPFEDAPFEDAPFGAGPFGAGPFGAEVLEGSESESGSEAEHDGFSGYTYAGRADNAMPAPAYEAKVAAKAAATAAAATAAAPVPLPAEPAATEEAAARHPAPPAVTWTTPFDREPMTSPQVTTQVEVIREAPEPNAPAPAPKHAPSGPTASSNSSTDSGGGHRGGVIAAFTTESIPYPLTASSAERRNDWRSPGSIPGLPSTSPD